MVAHRLVRSVKSGSNRYLITRGDATVCCDLPVLATSVLGPVIGCCATGSWQPVGPPPERWFGFRWLALLISSLVGAILRVSPAAAVWTAKRIIGIHRTIERATGFLKRRAAWGSRRGSTAGAGDKKRADPPDDSRGSLVVVRNLFSKGWL